MQFEIGGVADLREGELADLPVDGGMSMKKLDCTRSILTCIDL